MMNYRSAGTSFFPLSRPTRGALLMVGSSACLAGLIAAVRFVSGEVDSLQVVFFRYLFGFLFLLPYFLSASLSFLRTKKLGLHLLRALSGLSALVCLFTAVELLPLATVTALMFAAPLFSTAGSAVFLGENVRSGRWVAVCVGFLGTLVILRPGVETFEPSILIAIAAALFIAVATLTVKSLSRTERPEVIVIYFNLLVIIFSLIPALYIWETPSPYLWKWLILIGALATASQLLLTQSLSVADASAVVPFSFSQLVFVAILGFVFYSEVPDLFTWLGSTIVFLAALYLVRKEC